MSTTTSPTEVDPAIWRAVSGSSVEIPTPNSYVYYFPQGHLEHTSTNLQNYNSTPPRPYIPCHVISVRFLSSSSSDQVFSILRLQPVYSTGDVTGDVTDDVVSFAKILTPSDANNGGGFSVPRFCADSIFPPLDFTADPPVQNLSIQDTLGKAWSFRHIYRGTPRRHLLTTGWSKFVNAKRLITGDSVVFMRKKSMSDKLFIGIRRAGIGGIVGEEEGVEGVIERAGKGEVFEVVYCPRFGGRDFVVRADKVEGSLGVCWSVGMRVKMAVETEDLSRVSWCQGTVTGVGGDDESGVWLGSPWRMLQVTWDEPETMQNMDRVSPWQVEYIPPNSHFYPDIPPPKRFKLLHNSMMPSYVDGGGLFFPETESDRSIGGSHLNNQMSVNHNTLLFPSMQGARLEHIHNSNKTTFTELLKNNDDDEPEGETVSTVLNIGKENLSPESQTSVYNYGSDLVRHNSFTGVAVNSIQLFGQTIQIPDPGKGVSVKNFRCRDGERNDEAEERNVHIDLPRL